MTFTLDLARDDSWLGRRLALQVLRPGTDAPVVPLVQEFVVGDLVTVTVPLDVADGDWVLLRVADPTPAQRDPRPRRPSRQRPRDRLHQPVVAGAQLLGAPTPVRCGRGRLSAGGRPGHRAPRARRDPRRSRRVGPGPARCSWWASHLSRRSAACFFSLRIRWPMSRHFAVENPSPRAVTGCIQMVTAEPEQWQASRPGLKANLSVGPVGLEPTTKGLKVLCSAN